MSGERIESYFILCSLNTSSLDNRWCISTSAFAGTNATGNFMFPLVPLGQASGQRQGRIIHWHCQAKLVPASQKSL